MGGGGGCGDFCCVGDCCIANCGFCCVFACSDCGDCCVGHCGDRPTSSKTVKEDHAAVIANELAEMRKRATTDSKKDEESIIVDVNETMTEFIKWVQDVNKQKIAGKNLNINIDKIKELNEELRNKIIGFIGKKLDDKFVMTDPQVSTILAERDATKRKKNFDSFYVERRREAIREMIKEVETSVREQSESIEREIQNRIRELNNNMAQETQALEELKKLKEQEDSRVAEKQVEYMYYADLCDTMFDELKTSNLKIGR